MPFLYVWFVVNSEETSKGSIPGEQLWVGMWCNDREEGICEVECILKVVGGRGAVQSIPSTLLVRRKTSPVFTPILLVSSGP